ncbi:MAG: DUF504 domain-containing protein [Methanomicrobiaceae archaeon]|uniref:MJ1316 RNA cyclic group end recognition domain-containing protein n=1 Tax=hydrocarbon metagenome TaxID=938273 RepID=A0A0W8FIR8_9ZZZZ|nr:DUF504 domain-containing protein [Methanomicrobiaceae archaeon]MDD5418660.1 DUF504 domain-containing protein [Methanomicrobiaceae archaeon]
MRTSHRLLLRLFFDPQFDFDRVRVVYVNRGAPADRSSATGSMIRRLDADYMEIAADDRITCIPYHRITAILYDGGIVWERPGSTRAEESG